RLIRLHIDSAFFFNILALPRIYTLSLHDALPISSSAAALEVFAGKGYHRAIVDDIVRASGTSKGAVYHHFPNKEAVFVALDVVEDRKSTRLNSSHVAISYAVFCLKKKKTKRQLIQ